MSPDPILSASPFQRADFRPLELDTLRREAAEEPVVVDRSAESRPQRVPWDVRFGENDQVGLLWQRGRVLGVVWTVVCGRDGVYCVRVSDACLK